MTRHAFLLVLALGLALVLAGSARAQDPDKDVPTAPTTKPDGSKWRIGYLEGGPYPDYETIFLRTVEGLINLGWIDPFELPAEYDSDHEKVWNYVAANARSEYIEFVRDAFYTSDFDKADRAETRKALLQRLNDKGDIDLMLAMGTWAGQDLANADHDVPTIVCSTSDPLGSGIILSPEDSGLDHLHAKVDPDRYERQVRLFHELFGFTKLGLVYEDSAEGRTFAAVDAVERVSNELGFDIVRCIAPFSGVEIAEAEMGVAACYREVAATADAIYITVHRGVTENSIAAVVEAAVKHQIPTFSMLGSDEVRHGVLLSMAQAGFTYVGLFHAKTIARVFNGARPRDLNQIWFDPPTIALNIETAQRIGYDPSFDILTAADEIYTETE